MHRLFLLKDQPSKQRPNAVQNIEFRIRETFSIGATPYSGISGSLMTITFALSRVTRLSTTQDIYQLQCSTCLRPYDSAVPSQLSETVMLGLVRLGKKSFEGVVILKVTSFQIGFLGRPLQPSKSFSLN